MVAIWKKITIAFIFIFIFFVSSSTRSVFAYSHLHDKNAISDVGAVKHLNQAVSADISELYFDDSCLDDTERDTISLHSDSSRLCITFFNELEKQSFFEFYSKIVRPDYLLQEKNSEKTTTSQ
jgi:hypothetical protein